MLRGGVDVECIWRDGSRKELRKLAVYISDENVVMYMYVCLRMDECPCLTVFLLYLCVTYLCMHVDICV